MAKRGGWFKSFSDENNDDKIAELNDTEYRIWRYALNFCNQSPWRYRHQGLLYHSDGFIIKAKHFQRRMPHHSEAEIEQSLKRIQEITGKPPLISITTKGEIKITNWRKRQEYDDESTENLQNFSKKNTKTNAQDIRSKDIRSKDLDIRKKDVGQKPATATPVFEIPEPEWKTIWEALSACRGWSETEGKTRPKVAFAKANYPHLDLVRIAKDMRYWLEKPVNALKKGNVTRYMNFVSHAETFRLQKVDENTAVASPEKPANTAERDRVRLCIRNDLKYDRWKQRTESDRRDMLRRAEISGVEELK